MKKIIIVISVFLILISIIFISKNSTKINNKQIANFTKNQKDLQKIIKNEKFCGRSTLGKCKTDKDCIEDGCSNQICRSKFEEPVLSTCEYKPCYNSEGYSCKCINNSCQWSSTKT